jgi:hypothetical protein
VTDGNALRQQKPFPWPNPGLSFVVPLEPLVSAAKRNALRRDTDIGNIAGVTLSKRTIGCFRELATMRRPFGELHNRRLVKYDKS